MRIVSRATLMSMPVGTVYARYQPCFFGDITVKGQNCGDIDWLEQRLVGDFIGSGGSEDFFRMCDEMEHGASHLLDFDIQGREGLFDDKQLYAVFEPTDLSNLIQRLQMAQQGIEP